MLTASITLSIPLLTTYPYVHDDVRGALLDGERVVKRRLVVGVFPAAASAAAIVTVLLSQSATHLCAERYRTGDIMSTQSHTDAISQGVNTRIAKVMSGNHAR